MDELDRIREDYKEKNIKMAKREIAYLRAMKELAKADNDCVATLMVDGIKHAFSTSQVFLPIIDHEIKEIQKSLNGKPNKWE